MNAFAHRPKKEIERLKHELHRKEKGLAEVAAMSIASTRIQAFWGDGADV